MRLLLLIAAAGAVSCNREDAADRASAPQNGNEAAAIAERARTAPLNPPRPGTPGGLEDDRTPLSEAPFTETSAQGAANVVQTYYALLGAGEYGRAYRLWSGRGRASGLGEAAFEQSMRAYAQYRANVGAPGRIEGTRGTLFVQVPVQVYGRRLDGSEFSSLGAMRLRRSGDGTRSSSEDGLWRLERFVETR